MAEPTVAGELVVQNGRHKGTALPLAVPATLIGSAEVCDVRVTGPGVVDVHCLVTVTPAGPALRSWAPEETWVNGEPTAAALLRDGDEVKVGPCVFRLAWHAEEIIPLTPAPIERYESDPPDVPFEMVAERAVHDQEAVLAALLYDRQRRLAVLLEELADKREFLRQYRAKEEAAVAKDREKVRRMMAQTDRLRRAAREDRLKAKRLAVRFAARFKQKWSAERKAVESEWAALARRRDDLAAEAARLTADRDQFHADIAAYQRQLHDAWELLTEGQRRLLADRQEAEQTVARQRGAIERRSAELTAQAAALEQGRERVESRVQALLAEVARLEVRATHARSVVEQLEEKRRTLEGGTAAVVVPAGLAVLGGPADRVELALDARQGADELIAELAVQKRDLGRERNHLVAAHREVERRAAEVHDQRCVVAEQLAALVVAREMWLASERQTVSELEALAVALTDRELAANARDRELAFVERSCRRREDDLRELRRKLEDWQADLADREAALADARSVAAAEFAVQRDHLAKWEAGLADLARRWNDDRTRESDNLRAELTVWADARRRHLDGLRELDRARTELAEQAAAVAAQAVAVEQAREELAGTTGTRLADRRLRVTRRRWERHFGRFLKDLDARRVMLAAESALADDRYNDLVRSLAALRERRAAVVAAEQAGEAARFARARELDERETALAVAELRRSEPEPDVIPLRPALALRAA